MVTSQWGKSVAFTSVSTGLTPSNASAHAPPNRKLILSNLIPPKEGNVSLNPIKWWKRRQEEKRKREITKVAAAIGLAFAKIEPADLVVVSMLQKMTETGYMPPELTERESIQA